MMNSALCTSSYLIAYIIRNFIFEVSESSDFIWTEWSLRNHIWFPSLSSRSSDPGAGGSWSQGQEQGVAVDSGERETCISGSGKGQIWLEGSTARCRPGWARAALHGSLTHLLRRGSVTWCVWMEVSPMDYWRPSLGLGTRESVCSTGNFWNYHLWLKRPSCVIVATTVLLVAKLGACIAFGTDSHPFFWRKFWPCQ